MAEDNEFKKLTIDETLAKLSASVDGLTSAEAGKRITEYGKNEVSEKKKNPVFSFLRKFWAPVPWMLEVAIILTYVLHKFLDMYIIAFLLVFNGIIAFTQEKRAENAVELLKQRLNVKARVRRDGSWNVIEASALVPGDIIHVRSGDIIPADIKIIDGHVLVDQSALTGESIAVGYGNNDIAYSGSLVKNGESTGIIVATGSKTFFGKTTELVKAAGSESHLEKLILNIVKYLIAIDVTLVAILVVFSLLTGVSYSSVIPFALIVLIVSIPVALPATFTIAMALGARELSGNGILVTRLVSAEDVASMDVLNLDKTGTITENKLTAGIPIPYGIYKDSDVLKYAYLASSESSQDPIDLAVIEAFKKSNVALSEFSVEEFVPFDPKTKRTEATIKFSDQTIRVMKGAPQIIADMATFVNVGAYYREIEKLSKKGFRVIAVGKIGDGKKCDLVGLLPLYDPPRKDSKAFIQEIKDLNVVPKMVTGDNSAIANEIGTEVGIGGRVCSIDELKGLNDSESEVSKIINSDVFAEVFPEDKILIVRELQKGKHYVGMTGDGVNDAPALKQAEVGIAVSNATDVAKASASMVLTHEGLSDIVNAIKVGRRIFQRMLTYTINKIVKTIQVAIFLTLSFFVVRFFVTTPFDIVLLLFANDFVTMSIATDNARYSMHPEKWSARSLIRSSLILSVTVLVESFFTLWVALYLRMTQLEIHTFIFDMLVFSGQLTVYVVRERGRMWSSRPSTFLMVASILDIIAISLLSVFGILVSPLSYVYVLIALGITFGFALVLDQVKISLKRDFRA
ncbi:MAG: plasma-membrane proton-efflux P-type ATPase [Candidatus Thermoplasmatota archaeon]|nr:plasma-membrane proton-efflux P-type ATPase [Candidatus Thermoplasmatota archaeon]MCL5989593.1 plasma-membrane proton-efflux P-type ATPase [Candidatus Thermoplasmatota archaeon]